MTALPSTASMIGCGGEAADDNLTRLPVDFAGSRADLFIGIGGDIFHEEIEYSGIALQHAKHLERAVFRGDYGRRRRLGRRGWRFGREAEFRYQIFRQLAAE